MPAAVRSSRMWYSMRKGLDQQTLEDAVFYISHADMLIIGGTSLAVYPAAGLIDYYRGNKLVLINKSTTPMDARADLLIQAGLRRCIPGRLRCRRTWSKMNFFYRSGVETCYTITTSGKWRKTMNQYHYEVGDIVKLKSSIRVAAVSGRSCASARISA